MSCWCHYDQIIHPLVGSSSKHGWSNWREETQSRTLCPLIAVLHWSLCSWGLVPGCISRKLMTGPWCKKILLLVSPYTKLFSEKLEHRVSLQSYSLYVEIPNLFSCLSCWKRHAAVIVACFERDVAKLTCWCRAFCFRKSWNCKLTAISWIISIWFSDPFMSISLHLISFCKGQPVIKASVWIIRSSFCIIPQKQVFLG